MLKEKLREDMKTAMKSGDKPRLSVVRMMLAQIQTGETQESPVDEMKAVQAYRRKIAQTLKDHPTDQLAYELGVIDSYLPKLASQEETSAVVNGLTEGKELTKAMFGDIMKAAKAALPNADGKVLSELIKAKLPQ